MRPATVLRSLIELSYESSIMATALDVAEAVASVLPAKRISGPGQQLDDVIRKQLGQAQAEPSVARRTAVTDGKPPGTSTIERGSKGEHSTGLFRKIGVDGVSTLEEMDIDPTGVAPPRHTEPMIKSPDSGLHRLLEKVDGDRRTEPGAPPTGASPKIDPNASGGLPQPRATTSTGGKSITTFTGKSRRGWWIAATIVALAGGGGFAAWKLKGPADNLVVPAERDAGVVEQFGVMEIDPKPAGAKGTYVQRVAVSSTMGPGVKVEPGSLH